MHLIVCIFSLNQRFICNGLKLAILISVTTTALIAAFFSLTFFGASQLQSVLDMILIELMILVALIFLFLLVAFLLGVRLGSVSNEKKTVLSSATTLAGAGVTMGTLAFLLLGPEWMMTTIIASLVNALIISVVGLISWNKANRDDD